MLAAPHVSGRIRVRVAALSVLAVFAVAAQPAAAAGIQSSPLIFDLGAGIVDPGNRLLDEQAAAIGMARVGLVAGRADGFSGGIRLYGFIFNNRKWSPGFEGYHRRQDAFVRYGVDLDPATCVNAGIGVQRWTHGISSRDDGPLDAGLTAAYPEAIAALETDDGLAPVGSLAVYRTLGTKLTAVASAEWSGGGEDSLVEADLYLQTGGMGGFKLALFKETRNGDFAAGLGFYLGNGDADALFNRGRRRAGAPPADRENGHDTGRTDG